VLYIHLPPDIEARLTELARETGRSVADYVREAIVEKIEELEDRVLAEERLRNSVVESIPLADVMAEFADDLRQKDQSTVLQ